MQVARGLGSKLSAKGEKEEEKKKQLEVALPNIEELLFKLKSTSIAAPKSLFEIVFSLTLNAKATKIYFLTQIATNSFGTLTLTSESHIKAKSITTLAKRFVSKVC
jgi:hypothetical protein